MNRLITNRWVMAIGGMCYTIYLIHLPFAEFLVGLLLLMGLFTRTALLTGAIIILLLLFGTSMIENWEAIPSQLIHLAFFCILLQYFEVNTLTLNKLFQKSKKYDQ